MDGQLLIIALCLAATAFFSGIEIGVISIHRIRLRHHVEEGRRWAIILDGFLEHPDRLLGTTLVGTNLCMITASAMVADLARHRLHPWAEAALDAALAVFVLVACEYLPKAWFQSQPMQRSRPFAPALAVAYRLFRPLAGAVTWLTRCLVPEAKRRDGEEFGAVTRDELKVLTEEGEEHGLLTPKQRIMIHRAFELAGKRATQIMVPRAKMVIANSTATVQEFLRLAETTGLTRLPVYDEAQKSFVGIANAFEALADVAPDSADPVAEHMRPPLFVRDNASVTEILPRLRRGRMPMCLVTDAQSSVIGLITTHNVAEQIVGKM
jgi:putative hemolysin